MPPSNRRPAGPVLRRYRCPADVVPQRYRRLAAAVRPGAADRGAALMGAGLLELLSGPVQQAAPGLLGCQLTGGGVTIRLTEVEAYAGVGEDPSSHAHRRQTPRNAVMFGPPGFAYVYFTYGMHWCLNVVCGPPGYGSAVLLRAGEVVSGAEMARARRNGAGDRDLARGPARLASALGIDGATDGTPLLDGTGPLVLTPGDPSGPVLTGPRVGVGTDTPWRFWIADDPTVSPFRRYVPRRTSGRPV